MHCKVTLFENSVKISLNRLSGQEEQSITNTINNFIIDEKDCDGIELSIDLDDESQNIEYGIICNANEKIMNKYLNKKTIINPPQYGLHSWGKVELLIELMNEKEQKLCKDIIDKLKQDKVILDAQLEEQTKKLKDMKLKKSSKKISNDTNDTNDDVSITSNASAKSAKSSTSATTSISEITTISDISLAKECSTTIRKCSKCKLPGHNISKCPMVSEKEIKVSNEKKKIIEEKETKVSNEKKEVIKEKETKVSNEKKDVKVAKKCSNCKLTGHNINKCPSRNDISSNSVPDTDSENESKVSKISGSTKSEKETSVRKCSKCSTPGHTIRKCPLNNV
jgi:hypothetical protein